MSNEMSKKQQTTADNNPAQKNKIDSYKDETTEQERTTCLNTAMYELQKRFPFFGAVVQSMNVMYSQYVQTLGVGFNADFKRFDMHINPMYFCKKINAQNRVAVLHHEVEHITRGHLIRVPYSRVSEQKRRLLNCGADLAINQYIQNLPSGCKQCPPLDARKQGAVCENKNCPGNGLQIKDWWDEDKNGKRTMWAVDQTMEYYYDKFLQQYIDSDGLNKSIIEVRLTTNVNLTSKSTGARHGKKLESTSFEPLTIDGIATKVGDKILVKNQDNEVDNGIYSVKRIGSNIQSWMIERYDMHDGSALSPVQSGDIAYVKEGTSLKNKCFAIAGFSTIKVDNDPMIWEEIDPNGNSNGLDSLPNTIDTHDWEANADQEDVADATSDIVKRAMIKSNLSHDRLPGHVQSLMDEIKILKANLNYKKLLLTAIKRSASGHDRCSTWTRKNKRYGWNAPGSRVSECPKLEIILDTSGSISTEELTQGLDIVDEFLKVGSRKCIIGCFHTKYYLRRPYRKGDRDMMKKSTQSGGTDLTDVFKSVIKSKSDLTIIFTDGEYSNVDVESMLKPGQAVPQVLFIISKNGNKDHPLKRIGNTIQVPNNNK